MVLQPGKVEGLTAFLEEINKISESLAANPGEQWSGSAGGAMQTSQQTGAAAVSARDLAIANLPVPEVMQRQLEQHIRVEVKKLRKQAQLIARVGKPGTAYRLNQFYARIRRLNSLLGEILEASYDVLKRLFVRVFVDKQSIA